MGDIFDFDEVRHVRRPEALFPLGRIVATPGALEIMQLEA